MKPSKILKKLNKVEQLIKEDKLQKAVSKLCELYNEYFCKYDKWGSEILDCCFNNGEGVKETFEGNILTEDSCIMNKNELEYDKYYKVSCTYRDEVYIEEIDDCDLREALDKIACYL